VKISARYEVLGLLGQGGMGVVYHVRDTTRGRENALKTLAPGRSEDIVERFLTEAQVMFRLEHSNIVRVYDFGKDGETYFLTMELIRGKNLRQLLNARQNKGFPLGEVVRMGIETSDALNYAHSQKPEAVVHRDIKPVNIMIEEETGRVVVTDFGIAKLMAETGSDTQAASDLSRTVFAGTVPYSAPEQFQPVGAARRLDARVDIYALGIVLYEIYTGRHFFAGLSADEVELHHRSIDGGECPVKTPHACDHKVVLPDTPASFLHVLERAIARDRNERYKTAAEMLADLQACAATEAVQAVESARVAAEAAGALDAAETDFRRGGELEQQAKAAQERGDHGKAGELYRNALQAFGAAAAQAGERKAQRAAQQAKAAMQVVAQEATERDTAALAPDAMRQAAQLVAAAEASEAQGQFEQAAAQYRQAEEAFRAALVSARQASARKEIESELPAVRAAREAAEQADAATFAADAFSAAVREQVRLEEALAAGELTRVRELLPKVRESFASAGAEASKRLAQNVDEARAAMRTVAAEATAAGAPTSAKAAIIEAESLAGAAEKLVARGELDLAIAQLGRATDAYRAATAAAVRAGEREVLERGLPAIRAARAEAEGVGAPELAADAFTSAAREQAELEAALAAGELTRVRTLLPKVGEGFAAAKATAAVARASQATVEARTAMERAREAALAAGAEKYVPDALAKARAREREGAGAEERQQWERAEQLYHETAKAFDDVRTAALRRAEEQRLASALAEARSGMEAARTRAKNAGAAQHAAELYREAGAIAKEAGAAKNDAAGMTEAAAAYARALDGYDAATAEAERVARRHELQETLAAVEEAKKQAVDAGAARNPEFLAAADELAAAERALAADELSLVVSSAAAARERFAAARTAAERAKAEAAANAALADVAAQCAEAREAGAEKFAAKTWARATEQQKQALARRNDGDCEAVLPLAAAADEAFAAALSETVAAAQASAAAAKTAAKTAGPDDDAVASADKSFATAEQRRGEKKLVAAAVAFRKAAESYDAAREARTAAARKAEADARTARGEAEKAEAEKFAADEQRAAVAALEGAAQALAKGRCSEAEKGSRFARAGSAPPPRWPRGNANGPGARRPRAAVAARERAAAGAAELAAAELKRASEAFAAGERALETENYAGSETEFGKAREAFERSLAAAERAALERKAKEVRARAERLRAERAAGATGFFTRRKLAKADAVLARGTTAAASGEFTAASAAFEEAAELFAALPVPATPPAAPAKPTPTKPAPAVKPKPGPQPAPAARKAPAAEAKPAAAPSESTSIVDAATAVAGASALEGTTLVASAPSLEGATMIASSAAREDPTIVGETVPATRGFPIVWIGAATAGVVLLAGVWMLRGRESGPTTPEPPKVATKSDVVPKTKPDVAPPPVEAKVAVPPREPAPAATAVEIAKVEAPPPVPPAPPVPRIASFAPETERVEPAKDTQQFRIALADPADATYAWSVDGKVLSDANQATVTVPAKNAAQRVAVVARTAGGEARHEWELAALAPPPEPVAPIAPVISGFEPREKTLQVTPGKSRRFSVKAKTDGTAPLRYAWSVDGEAAGGNAATFDFAAEDDDEGKTREVRAEVSSGNGPATRTDWTVTVPLAPVSITRQSPAPSEIVADLGDTTDFSVEARAGRTGGGALSYAWTVNKRPADAANGPRFTYRPERAGSADVEVRVEAPDRPAAVRRWTVRSREAAPVAAPTRVAALPPPVAPTPIAPRTGGDARRELESWIAAYRAAYQEKNVDRLVALGVLKPENRSKLATALNDLADLQVTIASSSIEVQGPDSAVVSLTREDSFNAGGRRQSQSINIKKNLRKVNGSWVAQ
jgi:hypothetical protein